MNKTILVVDDEKTARDFIVMAADAFGSKFKVDTASGVKEAVDKLNTVPYDALILDVSLPVMNGNILAVFVRKAFPRLPIAFLTNYDSETAQQIGGEIQAEYWYKTEKMANFSTLQKCMENLLDGLNCDGSMKIIDEAAPDGNGRVDIPDEFEALLNTL